MIFDWDKIDLKPGWEKSFKDIQAVLNAGIAHASKFRDLGRGELAVLLSDELDVQISKNTVNKWTRHDGNGHRFPVEYSLAFAKATGDPRVLLWPVAISGLVALTPRQARKFEYLALKQEQEKINDKLKMLEREMTE